MGKKSKQQVPENQEIRFETVPWGAGEQASEMERKLEERTTSGMEEETSL